MSRDPQQKKPKGEGPVGNIISDPVLLERYVAIADYVKQETNQCSLEAGQVVEVVEKNQHGGWVWPAWWVGVASMVGGCGILVLPSLVASMLVQLHCRVFIVQ